MKTYLSLIAVAFCGCLFNAHAEEKEKNPDPMETDRPDFTESTEVVPLKWFQIESGGTFQWLEDGESLNLPEMLLRYGIEKDFELRLGMPDYNRVNSDGELDKGFSEVYLGFKYSASSVYKGSGLSFIPAINVPTGDENLNSNHVDPELKVCWARDLSEKWGLAAMAYPKWSSAEEDSNLEYRQTLSLERELSEELGAFLEYAGAFVPDSAPDHIMHGGIAYALNSNNLIDLHQGLSVNGSERKPFVAAGYSLRF